MRKFFLPILVLLCLSPLQGLELDGRYVILLVGEYRNGDAEVDQLRAALLKHREKLRLDFHDIPLVTMGFRDSDSEREYFDRLGFEESAGPVLCVAEWGTPARFGPKRVVEDIITRHALPSHAEATIERFLHLNRRTTVSSNQAPSRLTTEHFTFDLPREFRPRPASEANQVFGPAGSVIEQWRDLKDTHYEMLATTQDGVPGATICLVRFEDQKALYRHVQRMSDLFSRNVSRGSGDLIGPTKESIRGNQFYKFEKQFRNDSVNLRREYYFYSPEKTSTLYLFVFQTTEADFLPMSPLFRDTVESLNRPHRKP